MSKKINDVEELGEEVVVNKGKKRRAKIKVWIFALIMAMVFSIISAVIAQFLSNEIAMAFYAICVLCELIIWLPKELKRVKRCFCRHCGEKYDYNRDVSWDVSDVEIKEKSTNPNSQGKQVVGVRYEHVDVECTCANCGEEFCFSQKFKTGVVYDNGHVDAKNIKSIMKNYFKV